MKIKLTDIVFDESIYPRESFHSQTIREYADAMLGVSVFPPIILEEGTNRLFDGYHRWKAVESLGRTEIEVEYHTIPKEIRDSKLTPRHQAYLYAASLNSRHGDRITPAEQKAIAREYFTKYPDADIKTQLKYFPVSQATLYRWVGDIISRRKNGVTIDIYERLIMGWNQSQIAKDLGIKQQRISEKLPDFLISEKQMLSLDPDFAVEDTAERFQLPVNVAYGILLKGLSDRERMSKAGIESVSGNVWTLEDESEIMVHVLNQFTAPGDYVADMTGQATDACLIMGRSMLPPGSKKKPAITISDKVVPARRVCIVTDDIISIAKDLTQTPANHIRCMVQTGRDWKVKDVVIVGD